MNATTLISVEELTEILDDKNLAILDCRFSLAKPDQGRKDYLKQHIPGAIYAHLDEDLSADRIKGKTGRHPLPTPEAFARVVSRWGIDEQVQVVVYDDSGGAFAARAWWMLRWVGHERAALLDGGWQAWLAAGKPTKSDDQTRTPRIFVAKQRPGLVVEADSIQDQLAAPAFFLVDSRSPERFRGEQETLDPVAGRIPGAVNSPHTQVIGPDGFFRSKDELNTHFKRLLGGKPASDAVFYCGSGVSATQNLLALAHAGLGQARLYPGSWSEWITDPNRPIEKG